MADKSIWTKEGHKDVRNLLASLIGGLLIHRPEVSSPIFLYSPWLTDFRLFENQFGEYTALFDEDQSWSGRSAILFSEALTALATSMPVRIVTIRDPYSMAFASKLKKIDSSRIQVRFAAETYHEKGLLCDEFYIEGSMNFTYYGVYCREEKLNCHTSTNKPGRETINKAFLEFDARWKSLEPK